MSCELSVVLDRARERLDQAPIYVLGEKLTGRVEVSVDTAVRCEGLDVELLYVRTDHHQGKALVIGFGELEPEHHSRGGRVRVFTGSWQPGSHSYPFELPVPDLPSYDGKKSSWSWMAYCRADVPWAKDAVDRAFFRVEVPASARARVRYAVLPAARSGGASRGSLLLAHALGFVMAPMFGAGAFALLGAAIGVSAWWLAVVGASLGLALALGLLAGAWRRARVHGPELRVEVAEPAEGYRSAGEAALTARPRLRCRAVPDAGTTIEHVDFTLMVRESTTERSQYTERTYDRPVHTVLWSEGCRVANPDDVFVCELPLPEPGTMPYSTGKDEAGRGVVWQVSATVVRALGTDPNEHTECELDVRPDAAPLSQAH